MSSTTPPQSPISRSSGEKILEIAKDCINNNKNISILNSQFDKKKLNQSIEKKNLIATFFI